MNAVNLFAGLVGAGALPARYVPKTGNPVDTTVIIDDLLAESDFETRVIESGAELSAIIADVGRPVRGDVFEVSGTRWKVDDRQPSTDPEVVVLQCHNDGAV